MADQPPDLAEPMAGMSLHDTQALVWRDHADSRPSFLRREADDCLADVDLDALLRYVRELRPDVACRLLPDETMGGNNLVRVARFDDGERWIARISLHPGAGEQAVARKRSDVHTMILLAERGLRVPKVYGYDATDARIGRSFVLMEYLPGFACIDLKRLSAQHKHLFPALQGVSYTDAFLREVAAFQARMSSIRMPKMGAVSRNKDGILEIGPRYGRGPWTSTAHYLEDWACTFGYGGSEEHLRECMREALSEEEIKAMWDEVENFPTSLAKVVAYLEDKPGETFPLAHSDLNVNNIIVDEEMNFLGVVDWDKSSAVPWELVGLPHFLSFKREGLNNYLWEGSRRQGMQRFLDREAQYIGYVEEAERKYNLDNRLSSCLKDKRCKYLAAATYGYMDGQQYHYAFIESLVEPKVGV